MVVVKALAADSGCSRAAAYSDTWLLQVSLMVRSDAVSNSCFSVRGLMTCTQMSYGCSSAVREVQLVASVHWDTGSQRTCLLPVALIVPALLHHHDCTLVCAHVIYMVATRALPCGVAAAPKGECPLLFGFGIEPTVMLLHGRQPVSTLKLEFVR